MKGATVCLILGTVLIAVWLTESLADRGFGVAFLVAGTTLVITGFLLATLTTVERRRSAKAEGARAPMKTLFPLLSFVFAALFIVILSPAIISIMINLRT